MPGVPVPPGYIRPDPEPGPHLPVLKKSKLCTHNDGVGHAYPSLADYVEYYVAQGLVNDLDDLVQNYGHLIAEVVFNWISTAQVGCVFAAKLARKPRENRWLPIVQLGALAEGNRLGSLLSMQLDVASRSHEAAALIFPDITTQDGIVALVNALCDDPSGRWYRTDESVDANESAPMSLIGLRWVLTEDKSVNLVLGFAPLETMPLTRQAPFTTLFLRIVDEKRTPSQREDGRIQVHLADLDSTYHPQERHDKIWDLTKQMRANQVELHMTTAARARNLFSIPRGSKKALQRAIGNIRKRHLGPPGLNI